jgi:hypothetical protein
MVGPYNLNSKAEVAVRQTSMVEDIEMIPSCNTTMPVADQR